MINLLGNLTGLPQQGMNAFPVGDAPSPIDAMGGVNQALAQNQQKARAMPRQQSGGGWRDILGMIGDALLTANGRAPMYAPQMAQRRQAEAIQNYLGQLGADPALMQLALASPEMAVEAYRASRPEKDPEEIRLMRLAGIDPASDEGKALIRSKLTGRGQADPNFVRELEALGIDPRSDEARELYYGRNSPAGYLLKPKGRVEAGGDDLPAVNSPDEARSLPPGTRFRMPDGRIGTVPGGQTATPSGNFPR